MRQSVQKLSEDVAALLQFFSIIGLKKTRLLIIKRIAQFYVNRLAPRTEKTGPNPVHKVRGYEPANEPGEYHAITRGRMRTQLTRK